MEEPLNKPTPLCIHHQGKRTKESADVREVVEEREEDTGEGEVEVNNPSHQHQLVVSEQDTILDQAWRTKIQPLGFSHFMGWEETVHNNIGSHVKLYGP